MKTMTLAGLLLAALVVSTSTISVSADSALTTTNSDTITEMSFAIENACGDANSCVNHSAAEDIVATTIQTIGVDSPLMSDLLTAATEAGMDADTLTALAIANGIDVSLASNATASGNNNKVRRTPEEKKQRRLNRKERKKKWCKKHPKKCHGGGGPGGPSRNH